MRLHLAICVKRIRRVIGLASGFVAVAAGCSSDSTTTPSPNPPPPPPPPPSPAVARWSEPATWPGNVVPGAGALVVIPQGKTIVLDVSPPALKNLTIEGTLEAGDYDLSLTTDWINVKGTLRVGTEQQPFTKKLMITLTGAAADEVNGMGAKVLGVAGGTLELHGAPRTAWTKLGATAAAGAAQLVLAAAVDWKAGDRIVVASTDLDPMQAEEAVVASASGTTVTLQAALRYSHYGDLQTFAGRQLDERAEVGLLTRNVVVRGDSASLTGGFGGHILVMQGGVAHIEGIELTRMGQKLKLARYPMHWHMAGAVNGQYFRNSSVWKTFNRCLTIHGTSNATVTNNVCYDNMGHAFFLEDGAETGNLLEGNLGLVTRRPAVGEALIPSDANPATYWITNPDNTYRKNVAAGSRGIGFWFALPEAPTGLSAGSPHRPRSTPLREFSDNVAHSNSDVGLNVDHGPKADLTLETTYYSPHQVPGDNSSAVVTAYFKNFTAYKQPGRAVWLRGSELRLTGALLADNAIGATFASDETFVTDAVFVGQTANVGALFANGFPVRGYEFYDGRVGAERVTFVNYQPNGRNGMSALGFNRHNGFPVSAGNYTKSLTFVNANKVFLENPFADADGDKAAVILDTDGSLTGTAGDYVAANNPLLLTPNCTLQAAWNAYSCHERFVTFRVRGGNQQPIAPLDVVRDDNASASFVGVPDEPWIVSSSVVPNRRYTVRFGGATPAEPEIYAYGMRATDFLRVSVPFPAAPLAVYRDYSTRTSLAQAASLAELDASAGDKYFYEPATGLVHLKAMTQNGRDWVALFVR
ncbi:MAG: G8 domain-containing protein [Gemmatimonadota bacterium]